MRTRGPRLGELLEDRGWITREQLLRALRNQKVVGGKLGTCLLEIDALSEEALLKALAEQQKVPFATPDDLRGIPDDALRLVPAKVARRLLVLPFKASGAAAYVALLDARDLGTLDELAFVTGRRVRPHVSTEVRLIEAIEKHYGGEASPRIAKLLDRLNRARYLWGGQAEATATPPPREMLQWDPKLSRPPAPDPAPQVDLGPSFASTVGLELPAVELIAPEPAPPPPPLVQPEPSPVAVAQPPPPAPAAASPPPALAAASPRLSVEAAEARLLNPSDRDDVGRALLDFAAGRARRAILFKLHRDEASFWMGAGEGADRTPLESFQIRLGPPSFFVTLQSGAALLRGPLAEVPSHAEITARLGGEVSSDLLLLPVRVRDRLVGVLWVEPRAGGFAPADLADLQRFAAKAAIAFELCIMRAKLKRA
jgi:hypothetical protein